MRSTASAISLAGVEQFVALEGAKAGWIDYEAASPRRSQAFEPPAIDERDLLTINYTSGTTSRPKGVMITHRNAYMNVVGTLIHQPMTPADRYLWTLPMFHANGWTFTWIVTAVGGQARLPSKGRSGADLPLDRPRVRDDAVRGADGADLACERTGRVRGASRLAAFASSPRARRRRRRPFSAWRRSSAGSSRRCTGSPRPLRSSPSAKPRPEHADLSMDERASIKARQGVELVTSGELRVVDEQGHEVPHDGQTLGEIVVRGNVVMEGYYNDPDATAHVDARTAGSTAATPRSSIRTATSRSATVSRTSSSAAARTSRQWKSKALLMRHPAVQEVGVVGVPRREVGRGAARVRRAEARSLRDGRGADRSSCGSGSRTSRRRTR